MAPSDRENASWEQAVCDTLHEASVPDEADTLVSPRGREQMVLGARDPIVAERAHLVELMNRRSRRVILGDMSASKGECFPAVARLAGNTL